MSTPWDSFVNFIREDGKYARSTVIRELKRWRDTDQFHLRYGCIRVNASYEITSETISSVSLQVAFPDLAEDLNVDQLRVQFEELKPGCLRTRSAVVNHLKQWHGEEVFFDKSNGYVANTLKWLKAYQASHDYEQICGKRKREGITTEEIVGASLRRIRPAPTYRAGGLVDSDREVESATRRYTRATPRWWCDIT